MSKVKANTTETPTVKRGRPTVEGSKRQALLAMRDAKRNAGLEIKRGRPKNPITIQVDVKTKTRTEVKGIKAPKLSKAEKQAGLKNLTELAF